jgi:hypothetical protein
MGRLILPVNGAVYADANVLTVIGNWLVLWCREELETLGDERCFAASSKRFEPAFEGFGMRMEDVANGLSILATVQKQRRNFPV